MSTRRWVCLAAVITVAGGNFARAEETPVTREQFQALLRQNQEMQQQLQSQQQMIESLTRRVSAIQGNSPHSTTTAAAPAQPSAEENQLPAESTSGYKLGPVNLTGEGAVAYFNSQPGGQNPKGTFRIDEAKLFLDAPVWDNVYFYSELDLASRESTSLGLNVGELYLDFEDVSQLWGRDKMLNVRAGRFYTPFGEEYLNRFDINNPLISHSVSDLWDTDDGVELYGKLGQFSYAVAVQNGGGSTSQALQSDKSVAGRIAYDPTPWLHLSASGMRTGNLNVNNGVSETWFGGGFFRSIGSTNTSTFHANLVEGDAQLRLSYLQLKAAGGYINYGDNDPDGRNNRDVYYYLLEGEHDFGRHFYAAARMSEVFAHNGFPIVGGGPMGDYLFGPLTTEYWRLSLGAGYRFNSHLTVKGEYSINQGKEVGGGDRSNENFFALEAAFQF